MLPVTVRNIEPEIQAKLLGIKEGKKAEPIDGKVFRVSPQEASTILKWIGEVKRLNNNWDLRGKSIFAQVKTEGAKPFSFKKPNGSKAFEVVGIPFEKPGFYVVELESPLMGERLLGGGKVMYVSTTALVTNMAVHFKWGSESSLVWVTSLNKGEGVPGALVAVRDCSGNILAKGETDKRGIVQVGQLPKEEDLPNCLENEFYPYNSGLMVSAEKGEDFSFVHSGWDDGISPWRFQVSEAYFPDPNIAHSVFDRTLLRAGEEVHMKHFLRRHTTDGFSFVSKEDQPQFVKIKHEGSGQSYSFPLEWSGSGTSVSDWVIPREAKLGMYTVLMKKKEELPNQNEDWKDYWPSGNFRVEEFRLPLMKGSISIPSKPLIASRKEVPVDIFVEYLAGGAAGDLPIEFRYQIKDYYLPEFEDFKGYVFAEGKVKSRRYEEFEWQQTDQESQPVVHSTDLQLDPNGSARNAIKLERWEDPKLVTTEVQFYDPNGEIQTISNSVPVFPSSRLIGLRADSRYIKKDKLKIFAAVVDVKGQPISGAPVDVEMLERSTISHRKKLVGGVYAYEHRTKYKNLGGFCKGTTDKRGILACEGAAPIGGNIVFQAKTSDESGNKSYTNISMWVWDKEPWWFEVSDTDRMDLIPEKKRYEVGDKAVLQVQMPFQEATALVTVEREGVIDSFVTNLSSKKPLIEIPIKKNYSPNIFVSVLAVRGRVAGVQPTALVDLGRPAFKLGLTEIKVGWSPHELKVRVSPEKSTYRVREKAKVKIQVRTPDGKIPNAKIEVIVAVIDEALLELSPNKSWDLLAAMMNPRGYGLKTSTAQMFVVGKRHFGLKALPQGGDGGLLPTRELFNTLLYWNARVPLDSKGEATVEFPLNDSLTSFKVVAITSSGVGLFGTGSASIRTTQDLMIMPGLPPLVREGDIFYAELTLRNSSQRKMEINLFAQNKTLQTAFRSQKLSLLPGEAKTVQWKGDVPSGF